MDRYCTEHSECLKSVFGPYCDKHMDLDCLEMRHFIQQLSAFRDEEQHIRHRLSDHKRAIILRNDWIGGLYGDIERHRNEIRDIEDMMVDEEERLSHNLESQRRAKSLMEDRFIWSLNLHLGKSRSSTYTKYRQIVAPTRMSQRCKLIKCYF